MAYPSRRARSPEARHNCLEEGRPDPAVIKAKVAEAKAMLELTPEQEWQAMRQEARKKLREQYRKGELPD